MVGKLHLKPLNPSFYQLPGVAVNPYHRQYSVLLPQSQLLEGIKQEITGAQFKIILGNISTPWLK